MSEKTPKSPRKLLLGIPKGSLEESTMDLFRRAGFRFGGSERSLWLSSNDPEIRPVLLRPQEIPLYVKEGTLDCGLAGWDWIVDNGVESEVQVLAELCYSKRSFRPVRWVLAVANAAPYQSAQDLAKAGHGLRISTELENVTRNWLAERGINPTLLRSWGATEAKVPHFADAIVEATETGASLEANGLRIVDTVIESTTRFFANSESYRDEWKRQKIEGIAVLLKSCLLAETMVVVHALIGKNDLEGLNGLIPSGAERTVWQTDGGMMKLELILPRDEARDVIPLLARRGASKISLANLGMLHQ